MSTVMNTKNSWGSFANCPWDDGMDVVIGPLWDRARTRPDIPVLAPPQDAADVLDLPTSGPEI